MFNSKAILRPKLSHFGLTTDNIDKMVDWYQHVLGMAIVHRSDKGRCTQKATPLTAVWIGNDEANHRIEMIELPGLIADPDRPHHKHLQHVAFEYACLDDLLGTYVRLKAIGINPVLTADQGATTSFYYKDPDLNSVELNVDNYGDARKSTRHMKISPDFAVNPMGIFVEAEKLIAARQAGATPWEIHERAWDGEFSLPQTFNPKVLPWMD